VDLPTTALIVAIGVGSVQTVEGAMKITSNVQRIFNRRRAAQQVATAPVRTLTSCAQSAQSSVQERAV